MMALIWLGIGAVLMFVVGGLVGADMWSARERGYLEMLQSKDTRIVSIKAQRDVYRSALVRYQADRYAEMLSPPAADGPRECAEPTEPLRGRGIITSACPTCGVPEVDPHFTDCLADGFRVCAACGEEWWTNVDYPPHKPTRYLTADECRQRGDAARAAMDAEGGEA